MNAQDYHSMSEMSASIIKQGLKSPLHMKYALDNKVEPTPAMIKGTQIHGVVLEGKKLHAKQSGKGSVEANRNLIAEHGEEWVVAYDRYTEIMRLADAVRNSHDAMWWLSECNEREQVFTWEHDDKTPARCMVDMLGDGRFADLKTCAQVDKHYREKQAYNLGYDIQMAWYHEGVTVNRGRVAECAIVWVQTKPPYEVHVSTVPDSMIEAGMDRASEVLKEWRLCCTLGKWYGVNKEMDALEYPAWVGSGETWVVGEENDDD